MNSYAGNHWYKCDLHLHTPSSECYLSREDTPEQWVARALEQGLTAVAVTDHNDYRGITPVMEAAKGKDLAVFPGVEITCDSSKIHILVLFDTDRNADTVRDFLNRCDIDSELVGKNDGTSLSVFEVCTIARKRGGMVIAAHIDEFNAISSMNPSNLDKLLNGGYLDAVQVTNADTWREYAATKDAGAMYAKLREEYGPDAVPEEIERWRKCYDRAKDAGLPMLSFSDNPCAPGQSKHGLYGIGSVYTWIQMDDHADMESLRQSLVSADSRIRMMIDSPQQPKSEPDFWIRSLEVRKTTLNPHQTIHLDFHPQLNCIIGGRGSGKSGIVRILSGVYRQLMPGCSLPEEVKTQDRFYTGSGENGQGIFTEDSEIEIRFEWYGWHYRMLVTDIRSAQDQKYSFFVIGGDGSGNAGREITDTEITELGFLKLMSAQVLVQRQIYQTARTPGALLERVDRMIPDMYILQARKNRLMDRLLGLSLDIRSAEMVQQYVARVTAETEWLEKIDLGYVSEQVKLNAPAMLERRKKALEEIRKSGDTLKNKREERELCLKEYEECLREIRGERTAFLERALKDDGNFRMEMGPLGSRESFRNLMKEVLNTDLSMISEDMEKLEEALFAKKNGLQKYQALMEALLDEESGSAAGNGTASENRAAAGNEAGPANGNRTESGAAGFSAYFVRLIRSCSEIDREKLLLFHPEDELLLFYHPNGVNRFFPMTNASSGEKATAVLSLVLAGSERPLVVDQPEDDMDNRIIYEEIISKIKRAKERRQLILVTHSANIAANADPELVISLDSRSKFVKVNMQGSMDNPDVRREICDVLEGGEAAFLQREKKYHL